MQTYHQCSVVNETSYWYNTMCVLVDIVNAQLFHVGLKLGNRLHVLVVHWSPAVVLMSTHTNTHLSSCLYMSL